MIDTIEFKCPTTGQRCRIVDGYAAYLMRSMDNVVQMEEAIEDRVPEEPMTREAIDRFKGQIVEFSDTSEFATEVTAAAQLEGCTGPISPDEEKAQQIQLEPEHQMDLCPMVHVMFPDAD